MWPWSKIKELNGRIAAKRELLQQAQREIREGNQMIDAYKLDVKDLNTRIQAITLDSKFYRQLWKAALHIPGIKDLVKYHKAYDPWSDPKISKLKKTISDATYYTYSPDSWLKILARVNKEIRDEVPRWISEISDCDNFAEAMSYAVHQAFIDSGKRHQGAFGTAHSFYPGGAHAFNFYVTRAGAVIMYEPQNGEPQGELNDPNLAPMYTPSKLFFMG